MGAKVCGRGVRDEELKQMKPKPDTEKLVGLALPGGCIRSATFSLGLLQVLQKEGLMKDVNYLSAFSGGGMQAALYGCGASLMTSLKCPQPEVRCAQVLMLALCVWGVSGVLAAPYLKLPRLKLEMLHLLQFACLDLFGSSPTARSSILRATRKPCASAVVQQSCATPDMTTRYISMSCTRQNF
jgi:hypothetical protein